MNRAMAENSPFAGQADIVRSFAEIGVGPGLEVAKTDRSGSSARRSMA
jgi:hypothetical protein